MSDKTITLPLGLSINDADKIGVYTNISGREYKVTDIKVMDVKNAIGASTTAIGSLCLSSLINKWAAFKPNKGGLALPSGMIISGNDIIYDKPTSNYRIGDFAGYNHNAPTPGVIENSATLVYYGTGTQSFGLRIQLPEFDVRDLSASIDGVIGEVSGVQTITKLTDAAIGAKKAFSSVSVANCEDVYTNFSVLFFLGKLLNGTYSSYHPADISEVCNFPSNAGGVLSISLTAYNVNVVTVSGIYLVHLGVATIKLSWSQRSSVILDFYELEVSLTGAFGGEQTLIYSGTSNSCNYDIPTPGGGEIIPYYFKVRFKRKDTGNYSNWSEIKQVDAGDSGV